MSCGAAGSAAAAVPSLAVSLEEGEQTYGTQVIAMRLNTKSNDLLSAIFTNGSNTRTTSAALTYMCLLVRLRSTRKVSGTQADKFRCSVLARTRSPTPSDARSRTQCLWIASSTPWAQRR